MNLTWRTDKDALRSNEDTKLPGYHHKVHLVYNLYILIGFLKWSSRSTHTSLASTPWTTPTCGSIFTSVGESRASSSPLWCPPSSSSQSPTSPSTSLMSLSPSGLPFVSSCFWTCEPFANSFPPENFALRSQLMNAFRAQMPVLSYLTLLDYCLITNFCLISLLTLVVVASAVHFWIWDNWQLTTWCVKSLSSVSESERAEPQGGQTGAGKYATFKSKVGLGWKWCHFSLFILYSKHPKQVALYLFPVLYLAWTITFFAFIIYKALDNQTKLYSIPTFKGDANKNEWAQWNVASLANNSGARYVKKIIWSTRFSDTMLFSSSVCCIWATSSCPSLKFCTMSINVHFAFSINCLVVLLSLLQDMDLIWSFPECRILSSDFLHGGGGDMLYHFI